MVALAGGLMVLAAVFYTTAVLCSLRELKWWHIAVFLSGFGCDSFGTHLMYKVSGEVMKFNFHSVVGVSALVIMGIHAFWAVGSVLKIGKLYELFHQYSKVALAVWFVAFITRVIIGMKGY